MSNCTSAKYSYKMTIKEPFFDRPVITVTKKKKKNKMRRKTGPECEQLDIQISCLFPSWTIIMLIFLVVTAMAACQYVTTKKTTKLSVKINSYECFLLFMMGISKGCLTVRTWKHLFTHFILFFIFFYGNDGPSEKVLFYGYCIHILRPCSCSLPFQYKCIHQPWSSQRFLTFKKVLKLQLFLLAQSRPYGAVSIGFWCYGLLPNWICRYAPTT